jgi:hypothetical protein
MVIVRLGRSAVQCGRYRLGYWDFLVISKTPRRLFSIAFCAIAAIRAADNPQPPCAGEAVPAYPAVDQPPFVKVWERLDWTPPACVGWAPASGATLVATAARFHHESGVEGLRRRIGAISQLAGWLYWSATSQRWQPFIVDAYALRGPSADQRRPDFSPAEIAEGQTLYMQQEDNLFGKAVYRIRILAASTGRLVFATKNNSPLRLLSIPMFGPGEIQSVVFLERESKDVWRYYSLARTGKQASLLAAGHQASLINRAVASYRYLAGIPADREPPAAR